MLKEKLQDIIRQTNDTITGPTAQETWEGLQPLANRIMPVIAVVGGLFFLIRAGLSFAKMGNEKVSPEERSEAKLKLFINGLCFVIVGGGAGFFTIFVNLWIL